MRLESASELQEQAGPEDSVVQEVSTPVYIAPKTPTLQIAANLSSEADMGLHKQPQTMPPWRGRLKSAATA
jgi:hypothetical protein